MAEQTSTAPAPAHGAEHPARPAGLSAAGAAAAPRPGAALPPITVRFFAAAKAAFGAGEWTVDAPSAPLASDAPASDAAVASDPAPLTTPGLTIAELLARAEAAARGVSASDAARVFARCSFLVDGVASRDAAAVVPAGATLDVLPPFAGG